MQLLFDGQALQTASRGRGVGRYAANLLSSLHQARPSWRIRVLEAAHLPALDRSRLPASLEFETLHLPVLPLPKRLHRWLNDRAFGDWLADHPADAFLSAHSFEQEGVYPLFGKRRLPHFVVLYDLIPQRFEEIYLSDCVFRDFYADRLRQTVDADLLLAISNWTARDYGELQPNGPGRVVAIGGAPDAQFRPLEAGPLRRMEAALRAKFDLQREFILNPSGQCWRKNSRGALLAYIHLPAAIRDQFDFVVACRTNRAEEEELRRLAEQHGVRSALRLTGFVADDELHALNQLCRVCIFPSFYEGIGLPIVEALQCGAPVVTHDCSSMPEFAGPHSFLADPLEHPSLTAALMRALDEPRDQHRAERIAFARQFTWEEVAERAVRSIEHELDRQRRVAPRVRSRLAWVTAAWPGSREMARLEAIIGELMARFSVELIVPDGHPGARSAFHCLAPVLRESELRERHRLCPFTHFLYDAAGDASSAFLSRLASRYPGLMLDDTAALAPIPSRDDAGERGLLARAVFSAERWTELRPRVSGPLYLLQTAGAPADPLVDAGLIAGRLAETLASLGTMQPEALSI